MGGGAWSLLDVLYGTALIFGFGWALVSLLGAEFSGHGPDGHAFDAHGGHGLDLHPGDHDGLAGHAHLDDGSVHLSPLSPIVMATALGGFGGFGLIGSLALGLAPAGSTLVALAGGLLLGLVMYLFYARVLFAAQGSTDIRVESLYGTTGTVITPIPANSLGEIALVAQGSRITTMARSATGEPISRGQLVIVQEMSGPVAIVRETQ